MNNGYAKKPDFDKCIEAATDLLYQQDDLFTFHLDIRKLKYDRTIYFDSVQGYCVQVGVPIRQVMFGKKRLLKEGCTVKGDDFYLVLYNEDRRSFERQQWTMAHEIGHIYLEHEKDEDKEEAEAHCFTGQLFMPDYSLYRIVKDFSGACVSDIAAIFRVSNAAAQRRWNTFFRKRTVHAGKKDQAIWEMQREKVELYFYCKQNGLAFNREFFKYGKKRDLLKTAGVISSFSELSNLFV